MINTGFISPKAAYKIGAALASRECGPDLGPHPPNPTEVGVVIISDSLWPSLGPNLSVIKINLFDTSFGPMPARRFPPPLSVEESAIILLRHKWMAFAW